jgi:hypothetical protein
MAMLRILRTGEDAEGRRVAVLVLAVLEAIDIFKLIRSSFLDQLGLRSISCLRIGTDF